MPRLSERLWLLCALLGLAGACKPKIGDDCKISTDCSAAGDRLCDITAPGGYCTIYNCEPGSCPEAEAVCVEFGAQRATAALCQDKQSPSPYGRAFCMEKCDEDSDCRGGYVCADLSLASNAWGAVLIDTDRGHRACVAPFTPVEGAGGEPSDFGDVCISKLPSTTASDGDTDAASGSGGAGGQSANGG